MITDNTIAEMREAESRKLTLQTEAAINLAIGMVLRMSGQSHITIRPESLKEFSDWYRVEQSVNTDGSYTISVVSR